MSRKYCDICGESHNNRGEGLCDKHRESEYAKQQQILADKQTALEDFLSLPDEQKWEIMFEHLPRDSHY
tara:strand:- start:1476 stop:1682 length:207 start_codon:yes stop_codon:yes gene_type:complete